MATFLCDRSAMTVRPPLWAMLTMLAAWGFVVLIATLSLYYLLWAMANAETPMGWTAAAVMLAAFVLPTVAGYVLAWYVEKAVWAFVRENGCILRP